MRVTRDDAESGRARSVTRDVPPGALTLSRVPQVDKPDYAEALRTRLRRSKSPR